MAQIANPRKQFQFSIQTPGLNPFLAQEVTSPDFEIEVVEHGDTNFKVKTGGIHTFGNITIGKISTALGSDNWVWDWIREVQDVMLGGGLIPQLYKRTVEIQFLSNDGVTIIDTLKCYGCWPCKINGIELKRLQSDNVMETIELCVDQVKRI